MVSKRPARKISFSVKMFLITLSIFAGAYLLVFNRFVVKTLIVSIISNNTQARISLKVKRASLFRGLDLRNIKLISTSTGEPIFEAKRVNLSFFLPSLLVGHIGIREFGVYDPAIHMVYKKNQWNYEDLTGVSKKKDKEIEKEASSPLPESISTYLPVKFYANIKVENLRFVYKDEGKKKKTHLDVSNVDFRLATLSKTITSIPLNSEALGILDTFLLGVNPEEPIRLKYEGLDNLGGDLRFAWVIYRELKGDQTEFVSRLDINSDELKVRRKGRVGLPVGFNLSYNTSYDTQADRLLINSLELTHAGSRWLHLKAKLDNVTGANPKLDLRITESRIALTPFYKMIRKLTGIKSPRYGGTISLAPLRISGKLDDLLLEGNVRGRDFAYISPGMEPYKLKWFRLALKSRLDAFQMLGFLEKPPGYDSNRKYVYGLFHRLDVKRFTGILNGAEVNLTASLTPRSGIRGHLKVTGYDLGYYMKPDKGIVDANLNFKARLNFELLTFGGKVNVRGLRWHMDRSFSRGINLDTELTGEMNLKKGAKLKLNFGKAIARNKQRQLLMSLSGLVNMTFGKDQIFDLDFKNFHIAYNQLHETFPGNLQHMMKDYRLYLSEGMDLKGRFIFTITAKSEYDIKAQNMAMELPFLGKENIRLDMDAFFGKNLTEYRKFFLNGLGGALQVVIDGNEKRKGKTDEWVTDVKYVLKLKSERFLKLHRNVLLKGDIDILLDMTPKWTRGHVRVENVDVEYREDKCNSKNLHKCYRVLTHKLNLNLPILHRVNIRKPVHMTDGSAYYFKGLGVFNRKSNFTVDYISSSHDPKGIFRKDKFFYMGTNRSGDRPGLYARLDYKNNVLNINNFNVRILRQTLVGNQKTWKPAGLIYGKQMFFNAANMDADAMEYGVFLQIKNLDLEPFLPGSRSGYDGIISADLQILANQLNEPLYNTSARLSVYRLSNEFSGFATRIVMPGRIGEVMVANTLAIPSIKLELKGGLIYSAITIKRGPIGGLFVRTSNEVIKQERIPLAQFMAQAKSEIQK